MRLYKSFLAIVVLLGFISCEEVVDIDLEESEPKLVVEASIIWIKGTDGNRQEFRLSTTSPFYEEELQPVTNASIAVTSENGTRYEFSHEQDGIYLNEEFQPVLDLEYELELMYNDQVYTATESFESVSGIDYVEQLDGGGFAGDEIEIKAFYTDPVSQENYYLFKFTDEDVFLELYEDEFTDGNQIFGYFSNEDIETGDVISIQMEGISREYYDYMFVLRSQVGTNQGGPFETMPAVVRGNIVNETNQDNFPFGYFRLSEADSITYSVE
ncbi:DUF4249 domain-containing protein [Christiangramia sp. OXR-203]|jgi:hypothetical protein|uniref:DUF4249 domain-containing protein n=1 Tax=Christiangramia sp. OXR-203 TaxID=3100176 RepID=UPI002AC89B38|nr:DUF4249 domain-containing protein [Christiangramia sp. OXR-203]WPY97864.1 DUF4249 domain-containing protein [Christiangramia sp. OXR-203]